MDHIQNLAESLTRSASKYNLAVSVNGNLPKPDFSFSIGSNRSNEISIFRIPTHTEGGRTCVYGSGVIKTTDSLSPAKYDTWTDQIVQNLLRIKTYEDKIASQGLTLGQSAARHTMANEIPLKLFRAVRYTLEDIVFRDLLESASWVKSQSGYTATLKSKTFFEDVIVHRCLDRIYFENAMIKAGKGMIVVTDMEYGDSQIEVHTEAEIPETVISYAIGKKLSDIVDIAGCKNSSTLIKTAELAPDGNIIFGVKSVYIPID